MKRYIILLRGINVGGKHKLPMANLRTLLTNNGFNEVTTYIQSGNILVQCNETAANITKQVHQLILDAFGYDVPVITLTQEEIKEAITNNPYTAIETDIKKLHVSFLASAPSAQSIDNTPSFDNNDQFHVINKTVYIHCPDGYGKTKYTNSFFEKHLQIAATTRNWRTSLKLLEMVTNSSDN